MKQELILKSILPSRLLAIPVLMGSLLLTYASSSFAEGRGQETHGGFAYECKKNGRTTVQLQDYEEGLTFKSKLDLGPESLSEDEKFELVMKRLERLDPNTAQRYRKAYKEFDEEKKFVTEQQMVIPGDSNNMLNPNNGCLKKPFVIQIMNPRMNQARYLINERLYRAATKNVRVGVKLHELAWADAFNMGHENSDKFRSFVFQISSDAMEKMTPQEYIKILDESDLVMTTKHSSPFSVKLPLKYVQDAQGHPTGYVIMTNFYSGYGYANKNLPNSEKTFYVYTQDRVSSVVASDSYLRFNQHRIHLKYLDGMKVSLLPSGEYSISQIQRLANSQGKRYTTGPFRIANQQLTCLQGLYFYPNGNLESCRLGFQNQIQTPQQVISVMPLSVVSFYENGILRQLQAANYNLDEKSFNDRFRGFYTEYIITAQEITWNQQGAIIHKEDISSKEGSNDNHNIPPICTECLKNPRACNISDLKRFESEDTI